MRRFALLCVASLVAVALGCGDDGSHPSGGAPVTFAAPRVIAPGQPNVYRPRLAIDRTGRWLAAWVDGFEFFVARSSDAGASWSAPLQIDDGLSNVVPATNHEGTWLVVTRHSNAFESGELRVFRSVDGGATWSAPVSIGFPGAFQGADHRLDVAGDRDGHWVIAWDSAGDARVFVAGSSDDGRSWTPATDVSAVTTRKTLANVAGAGGGDFVVTWISDELAADSGGHFGVVAARSHDGGRTWSAPVVVSGDDLIAGSGNSLATDGVGNWIAVWLAIRPGASEGDETIVLAASRSTDDGATWKRLSELPSGNTVPFEIHPAVAMDASGAVVLTHTSWDAEAATAVMQVQSADHGTHWTAPVMLSERPGNVFTDDVAWSHVATDGAGTWAVAWDSAALDRPADPQGIHVHDVTLDRGVASRRVRSVR